jgi:hypothetical protein
MADPRFDSFAPMGAGGLPFTMGRGGPSGAFAPQVEA